MIRAGRTTLVAFSLVAAAASMGCGGSSFQSAKSAGPSRGAAGYPQGAPAGEPSAPSDGDDSGFFGGGEAEAAPAAPAPSAQPGAESRSAGRDEAVAPRKQLDRPGLGTEWGETRSSRISTVPFVRADFGTPSATAMLHYNDEEGARAMASSVGFARTASGMVRVAGGAVLLGLRDDNGRFLTGFKAGGRDFVVGEAGRRYTIVVRNRTDNRFECVLSVDGLDVLDGRAASFGKRGYIVEPHGELEVDGFRQSTDTVAAFRFGSVRDSYAARKHGETRNVGVIGLALFHERGTSPFPWTDDEVQRRHDANPFPGEFAQPPN